MFGRQLIVPVGIAAPLSLGACDFLPQTGAEWGLALGIFGVLFLGAVGAAWWGMKKNKPKE